MKENVVLTSNPTLVLRPQETEEGQVVRLKLKKPKNHHKHVSWTEQTVDNEDLNKKKSKCCCIYKKQKKFGEPDDESNYESGDDECDSCIGTKKTHQLRGPDKPKEEN